MPKREADDVRVPHADGAVLARHPRVAVGVTEICMTEMGEVLLVVLEDGRGGVVALVRRLVVEEEEEEGGGGIETAVAPAHRRDALVLEVESVEGRVVAGAVNLLIVVSRTSEDGLPRVGGREEEEGLEVVVLGPHPPVGAVFLLLALAPLPDVGGLGADHGRTRPRRRAGAVVPPPPPPLLRRRPRRAVEEDGVGARAVAAEAPRLHIVGALRADKRKSSSHGGSSPSYIGGARRARISGQGRGTWSWGRRTERERARGSECA